MLLLHVPPPEIICNLIEHVHAKNCSLSETPFLNSIVSFYVAALVLYRAMPTASAPITSRAHYDSEHCVHKNSTTYQLLRLAHYCSYGLLLSTAE